MVASTLHYMTIDRETGSTRLLKTFT